MSLPARLESERVEGAVVVRPIGEVDLATAPGLGRDIAARTAGAAAVIADLSAVSYFDSSGIAMVDRLVGTCEHIGTPVRIVAPDGGPARFVMRLVAFREELIAPSLEEALASIGRPRT